MILGSASIDLLRQSGESLAGRIGYVDMQPFDVTEVGVEEGALNKLWIQGGFPDSFLAKDDKSSFALRRDLIRTYLERDVPQFGPRIPAETLERLWMMLAHCQGTMLNSSRLASGLSLSAPTTNNIDTHKLIQEENRRTTVFKYGQNETNKKGNACFRPDRHCCARVFCNQTIAARQRLFYHLF